MDAPVVGAEPPRHASSPPLPPPHRCGLCDKDTVHQIAQVLLLGLATTCVDSTTGDIFRTPSSVAVDTRRDLVDYLSQRADSFAAESSLLLLQGEGDEDPSSSPPPSHPSEIISDLAEDFAATRRGLLGRVSGWLLSESREDKIDDLVQDLEANGFWLPDRREAAAEPLLRGVDLRNEHHCAEGFGSEEALAEHRRRCPFRLVRCGNEGCEGSFSAVRAGRHDGECEYKVLPCEQGCGDSVVRREMDRHCITVCPMKLVNCPFYPVGCHSTVPRCRIPQHCAVSPPFPPDKFSKMDGGKIFFCSLLLFLLSQHVSGSVASGCSGSTDGCHRGNGATSYGHGGRGGGRGGYGAGGGRGVGSGYGHGGGGGGGTGGGGGYGSPTHYRNRGDYGHGSGHGSPTHYRNGRNYGHGSGDE